MKTIKKPFGYLLAISIGFLLGCSVKGSQNNAPESLLIQNGFISYTDTIPGTDISFEMVPIRGGEFLMGSPANEPGRDADEGPAHTVKVDPFWMGKFEVTWDEY